MHSDLEFEVSILATLHTFLTPSGAQPFSLIGWMDSTKFLWAKSGQWEQVQLGSSPATWHHSILVMVRLPGAWKFDSRREVAMLIIITPVPRNVQTTGSPTGQLPWPRGLYLGLSNLVVSILNVE